jgi:glycosyltransferase involved in cell wall biosynthesis
MPQQLAALDVLVLPSRATPVWKEQFGRVLTEAMACRVPVVGSDSGAIPEVIGEAGLIFPAGDASALAGCLARLQAEPALRAELAERGYQRVLRHYTQAGLAERTAQFYRQLAANHG